MLLVLHRLQALDALHHLQARSPLLQPSHRITNCGPPTVAASYMYFLLGPAFHGAEYLTPDVTINWIRSL